MTSLCTVPSPGAKRTCIRGNLGSDRCLPAVTTCHERREADAHRHIRPYHHCHATRSCASSLLNSRLHDLRHLHHSQHALRRWLPSLCLSFMYLLSLVASGSSARFTRGIQPVRSPWRILRYTFTYQVYSADKVIEPYFPRHRERDIYVSLLQKTDPPAPEQLLKAALVRRAVTNVNRIMRIREDKPALQALLQKGSIGDDLWNSLLAAEKELEAEVLETAAEANTFVEGWGQIIFQTATEVLHNEKMRAIVEQIAPLRAEKGSFLFCSLILQTN